MDSMNNMRDLHPGDIVRHFKRELVDDADRAANKYLYRIIGVATHSETREEMMVYQALNGAVMIAGFLKHGAGTPITAAKMLKSFEQKSGATICKDLKGIETGKVLCPCDDCVRNVVYCLGEVFPEM